MTKTLGFVSTAHIHFKSFADAISSSCGSTRIGPDGGIWVGRTTRAGEPSLFDIFDGEGRPIGQVTLDPNSSIVGFGENGALYTTRTDFVGLQWLQRRRVR